MNVCQRHGKRSALHSAQIYLCAGDMTNHNRSLYQGKALTLNLEQVTFPDGSAGAFEIVRHPGGAGVVALDAENNLCLIRQYRHAADGWIWEIPAGRIEHKENPLATAQRELAEEAGLEAQDWHDLGEILPSPGICDERIYLYLARGLVAVETAHEAEEFIEIHQMPLAKAITWCLQGKIVDAKTLAAIYLTQAWLETV